MLNETSIKVSKIYFGTLFLLAALVALMVGYERGIAFSVVFFGLSAYFLPSFIAALSQHNAMKSIFVLNFLTGWSLIGWVASIVWALYKPAGAAALIDKSSAASEIEHLAQLKDKGILTQAEFDARKSSLLAG